MRKQEGLHRIDENEGFRLYALIRGRKIDRWLIEFKTTHPPKGHSARGARKVAYSTRQKCQVCAGENDRQTCWYVPCN